MKQKGSKPKRLFRPDDCVHAKAAMCDFSSSTMSGLWPRTSAEGVVKDSFKQENVPNSSRHREVGRKVFPGKQSGR